jgi:hypothetical protein
MITTGTTCINGANQTLEAYVQALARRIKTENPKVKVGMYYRADMALEIAQCSDAKDTWEAHPEWRLKDDQGNVWTRDDEWCYH